MFLEARVAGILRLASNSKLEQSVPSLKKTVVRTYRVAPGDFGCLCLEIGILENTTGGDRWLAGQTLGLARQRVSTGGSRENNCERGTAS